MFSLKNSKTYIFRNVTGNITNPIYGATSLYLYYEILLVTHPIFTNVDLNIKRSLYEI